MSNTNGIDSRIAVSVRSDEAVAYMNRSALLDLIEELTRIAAAPPEECWHVHLGMFFSKFDEQDNHVWPDVVYTDELAATMEDQRVANFERAKITDKELADSFLSPFDMTIMHISDEMIRNTKKFSVR